MKKRGLMLIVLLLLITTGCTLFKKPLDKRTGFSTELNSLEGFIAGESWENAEESLVLCLEKWHKVKPWLQLELDHDVVNEIESKLIELTAFVETREKPSALANTRTVQDLWEDAGSK